MLGKMSVSIKLYIILTMVYCPLKLFGKKREYPYRDSFTTCHFRGSLGTHSIQSPAIPHKKLGTIDILFPFPNNVAKFPG